MSLKLIAYLVGCGGVLAFVSWLYFKGVHDEHARMQPRLDAAEWKADVFHAERDAERASAQRVEVVVRQVDLSRRAVSDLSRQAEKAPDAAQPLDPARADRLRAHDRLLCDARPSLTGCAASADAGDGGEVVRAVPPA